MVLSFKVFHTKRCFTLIRLLISRAPCTNNPLSIRHCSVFTPCERIPLSTIMPRSLRGLDCAVLFVCLLIFRRLTNNGPIAVIGDTVLQISYSPPFLLVPRFSFQRSTLLSFPRNADIIANVEIDPPSGENVEWQGVGVSLCPHKNIDLSRKRPFIYRYNTPNSRDKGVSGALRVGGR